MTIEDDIRAWALERPGWQQDVLVALARGEKFDAEQISALADRLIQPDSQRPNGAAAGMVLGGGAAPKQVRLSRVYNLKGVNALADDQELTFAPDGLTIIYGNNGSGKSGYARLIKGMVSARHFSEVLPNVFTANAPEPSAEITYQVDDTEASEKFPAPKPIDDLQQIRFYDEYCGDEYLARESTVTYRPSALVLLSDLIAVCDAVRAELQQRITDSGRRALRLPVSPETPAGVFLAKLSERTTEADIDQVATLPATAKDDLGAALQEVARLEASDARKERARLQLDATQIKRLQAQLAELASAVSNERLDAIRTLKTDAAAKRQAATIAATNTFENEPLEGVGSEAWRGLWLNAKAYATTVAYHDHNFPEVGEDARCVLCHQNLDAAAKDRFERFERYMTDTTEHDAGMAEQRYAAALNSLRTLDFVTHQTSTALVTLLGHDQALHQSIQDRLSTLEDRRAQAIAYFEGDQPAVSALSLSNDIDRLAELATALSAKAAATDVAGFQIALTAARKRQDELSASKTLADSADALKAEVSRLKDLHTLTTAKQRASTTGITNTATSLTGKYATAHILDRFTREVDRLKLQRVTLKDRGGNKGNFHQIPSLLDASNKSVKTPDVLSEGEQTVLGLAGFFTEAEFDESRSALVLDDPVTSLDHMRREKVARRLVELAKERQVIVFTHDLVFVNKLVKAAVFSKLSITPRWIQRHDEVPGYATKAFPWKAKDFGQRQDELRVKLANLRKERADLDEEAYEERVASWAGKLSELWESCLTTEVLDKVFDRSSGEVRPNGFRLLVKVTEDDNLDVQDAYGRISEWARRHNKSDETNFSAPDLDDLEDELDRVKKFQERTRKYL